jgi:hypothetical protein
MELEQTDYFLSCGRMCRLSVSLMPMLLSFVISFQPHFTSTSGGRYDAKGNHEHCNSYSLISDLLFVPGIPGWYGHGLYFSENFETSMVHIDFMPDSPEF